MSHNTSPSDWPALATLPADDARFQSASDGFGALRTNRGCLPLRALDVTARIEQLNHTTRVIQTFHNAFDVPLEATYVFPLPERAAVTSFKMTVGERVIEGRLKERQHAREEYDRSIRAGHQAAIAEEERSGVFSIRVGNIPPGHDVAVNLTLCGELDAVAGDAVYRFPLVVAPRYTPGTPLPGGQVGDGVASDTDQAPDASRVTPPVLLPGFPNPVELSVEVEILNADELSVANPRLRSSLHTLLLESGASTRLRLCPGERLNRDFIVTIPMGKDAVVSSFRASCGQDANGVFAVTLVPPLRDPQVQRDREVVFVLDRSGSMEGWKMVAARRCVGRMIDNLLEGDRFQVIAFDNTREVFPAAGGMALGTNRQRWQAVEWLSGIDARGGTEMKPALRDAAANLEPTSSSERVIVLVTDGQVTNEDDLLRGMSSQIEGRGLRIHTVGIDRAVNAGFLQRLADLGHGVCELVESEQSLDNAMERIHRQIAAPVLRGLCLTPLNFELLDDKLAPARLPDLFAGRPVTVYGRHEGKGAR